MVHPGPGSELSRHRTTKGKFIEETSRSVLLQGYPEQVGNAGLLFDPNNPEDMADKIYKLWTDKEARKEFVKKGN